MRNSAVQFPIRLAPFPLRDDYIIEQLSSRNKSRVHLFAELHNLAPSKSGVPSKRERPCHVCSTSFCRTSTVTICRHDPTVRTATVQIADLATRRCRNSVSKLKRRKLYFPELIARLFQIRRNSSRNLIFCLIFVQDGKI